jgi:hypothetical protein
MGILCRDGVDGVGSKIDVVRYVRECRMIEVCVCKVVEGFGVKWRAKDCYGSRDMLRIKVYMTGMHVLLGCLSRRVKTRCFNTFYTFLSACCTITHFLPSK